VPNGDKARHSVQGRAEVISIPFFRCTRMHRHPHVQGAPPERLAAEGLLEGSEQQGRVTYRITPVGAQALEDRSEMMAAFELRKGVRLRASDSFEPIFERFKARLAPLSRRVDPETLAAVLDRAAAESESLNGAPKMKVGR